MEQEKSKKEEIVTLEELKKNIESTLRDINSLINPKIGDTTISDYIDSKIVIFSDNGLILHSDVAETISAIQIILRNKDKIESITKELLLNIREALLWERINKMEKDVNRQPQN